MSKQRKAQNESIDETVRQVRGGDIDAFAGIVQHFELPLRAWLASCSPPGIDVDEIAQRSFVIAFSRIGDYELGTDFSAWLFTIARYQLMTEKTRLRRIADYHSRYGHDLVRKLLDREADEGTDLSEQRLVQLRQCMEKLNETSQALLSWRYHDEITLEEMSQRLGKSTGAIKKQLWSIRRTLQSCIRHELALKGVSQ